MTVKRVDFSRHALEQMEERGASKDEVRRAIWEGEKVPAKKGRTAFRINLQHDAAWCGKKYRMKQVLAVAAEEAGKFIVVTVYVFYF
jgi:hypothetical protein